MKPSLVARNVALILAGCIELCLAGCIESHRPRYALDVVDSAEPDGAEADAAVEVGADATGADASDGAEDGDGAEVVCGQGSDCPVSTRACHEFACVGNDCVEQPLGEGSDCDDGDPCTGAGSCHGGECTRGAAVVDGSPCDDGLVCNGVSTCWSGQCVFAVPPTCPPPSNACADGATCSEALGGACVDLPVADGKACSGPPGALDAARWQCNAGRCVPPDMVFVPGGAFTMGCPEGYCQDDNGPAHEVRLSPYAIDRTEVSEGDFRRCKDDADQRGTRCEPRDNEEFGEVTTQSDAMPLRWVDWDQAVAVCAYDGKRLCTEAEWEYAARGTSTAFYPWGNLPPTCLRATFFDDGVPGCGNNAPSEVGAKPAGASPWGAFDLAGNVVEWCLDFYRDDLYGSRVGVTPLDPVQGEMWDVASHVVRGGSYRDDVQPLRVFVRSSRGTTVYSDDLGVRCCLSLTEP